MENGSIPTRNRDPAVLWVVMKSLADWRVIDEPLEQTNKARNGTIRT